MVQYQKGEMEMLEIINKYATQLDTNMAGIARLLNAPISTVWRWSRGEHLPGGEYMSRWYQAGGWMRQFTLDILETVNK
jgi:hypothetical protein